MLKGLLKKDFDEKQAIQDTFVASPWQLFKWKFLKHRMAVISLVFLALIYLGAIFAEFVSPYDPYKFQPDLVYAPPQRIRFVDEEGERHIRPFVYPLVKSVDPETFRVSYTEDRTQRQPLHLFVRGDTYEFWGLWEWDMHLFGVKEGVYSPLGKDSLGRDLLTRIIYGSRISLSIGLIGVFIGFFSGLLLGGMAGLLGGIVDQVIMRLTEIFMSIPTLPIWMALSVILPQDWTIVETYIGITVILALFGVVTGASRTVRGKFLALKEEDFVMAARLDGAGNVRLIMKYLFPNFLSHQIADLTMSIPSMILGETALSFLGLGLQAPAISWGVLLQEGRFVRVLAQNPWLFIPAIFVVLTILAFNFVGDGLRDAADPYARV
jgi:peptide/nickel transport system permease protein